MRPRRVFQTGLVVLAAAAAVLPLPAALVDRWFSTGVYPPLQRLLTPFGNLVPFAWFDVMLVAAALVAAALIVRTWRGVRQQRRVQPVVTAGRRLVVAAAALYLVFLALWGLHYRRVPMRDRLVLDAPPSADAVMALGEQAVEALNALHAPAHTEGWGDPRHNGSLTSAFATVQQWLEGTPPIVPGRLKPTLLGPYFRWTGVDGMINPFALEVLVNPDLLPWERPFVAAHEWSHLAGFADEAEANFVAFVTCVRAGPAAQYSAWLFVFWEVTGNVAGDDRERLRARLDEGPSRDVAAIIERLRRGQLPALRTVSWAMYDQYLRANRVEEGVRSYGEAITLILRTRFETGYRPVRRESAASSR